MPKQTDSIELTNSLQGTVEYTASQEIIPEEKILQQGDFTYTTNGERTENPSEGYDGFSTVAVNVNVQPVLQSKSVSYTENNDYTISPDDGYQGLSAVNVNVNVSGGSELIYTGATLYDYDGTVIAEYTPAQLAALDAWPAPPAHTGLVFQEYNWSLADAKAFSAQYGYVEVGANYTTDTGETRVHITLCDGRLSPWVGFGINGTATIDWGDGSALDTVTGTNLYNAINTKHDYASAGDYIIKIAVVSGGIVFLSGWGSSSTARTGSYLVWGNTAVGKTNEVYQSSVIEINVGNNARVGSFIYLRCLEKISLPSNCIESGTSVGSFTYCENLKYVTIPSVDAYFTEGAFRYCYGLTNISFGKNVYIKPAGTDMQFGYCFSLKSLVFSSNDSYIPFNSFANCYGLRQVIFGSSYTVIVERAFEYCEALAYITPSDSLTTIGQYAFNACRALKNFSFVNTIETIAQYAFNNCYSLKSPIKITGLKTIGPGAFNYCNNVPEVSFYSSIETIGSNAFGYCSEITSVSVPNVVISSGSFNNCTSLQEIVFENGITNIPSNYCASCQALEDVTIPGTVTSIEGQAFATCRSLRKVTLPNSVSSIGEQAFSNCESLREINIPTSLSVIPQSCFVSDISLSSIVIPISITSISASAFNNCKGLGYVKFEGTTPPTVANSNAWANLPTDCIIYVPYSEEHSVLTAYTTATNYPSSSTYTYVEY